MEGSRRKNGFTLVELLAVIVILAIVVGITIPAILTTTSKSREKAFKTAADSIADWFDRQYQVSLLGISDVASLDPNYATLCARQCYISVDGVCSTVGISTAAVNKTSLRRDYYNAGDSDACNCNCDKRLTYLTSEIIVAAGLKRSNIQIMDDLSSNSTTYEYNGLRVQKFNDGYYLIDGAYAPSSDNKHWLGGGHDDVITNEKELKYSRVYINPDTGRSCVTLHSVNNLNGDYPADKVTCGGVCQQIDRRKPDYCKEL